MHLVTRRAFCAAAPLALFSVPAVTGQPATARPDVASIDRDRILTAANAALAETPVYGRSADMLLHLSRQVSALAAAFLLTKDDRYAMQAACLLRALNFDPTSVTHFEAILDTVPLAEIAQSLPFLARSSSFPSEALTSAKTWFATYSTWLTTARIAGLARDQKDHHGASWLFQTAAYARLMADETILTELRHRYKTVTVRAQLVSGGTFPHELSTSFPYRNSLFTLDLLAAVCQLLSTPFDKLWDFELQDGPGLRIAIARHFPYLADRAAWPFRADLDHFTDLPARRPALLLAARAYTRPEYAALWRNLNPDPVPALQSTFPINQPILWTTRL